MRPSAGSARRLLLGALVLGLVGAAQAGMVPARATFTGATQAARATAAERAHSATARNVVGSRSDAIKPRIRKPAEDSRERAWRSRFLAHPVPAPRNKALAAATSRRLRSAAARSAFRRAAVSRCSGQIVADTLYSCQNPSGTGTDTYTLTLPAGSNVLVFQATDASAPHPAITVTAPDGTTTLNCQQAPVDECPASQQGTYTVAVTSDDSSYTLEYTALLSETGCPSISLSFAAASLVKGSLTAGQTGDCYQFSAAGGDNLYVYEGPYGHQVDAAVFDAAGNMVCAQVNGTCTLTGSGPYRVLASSSGRAKSYTFQIADLTHSSGCVAVPQQIFGQVPAMSADLCGRLTVTTAGGYQIYSVDKQFGILPGTLYTASGGQACTGTGWACQLTPGTYNFVQDTLLDGDEVSTVFMAAAQSRGCVAASDTSFASGDATGTFGGAGEELCRTLPTQAGLSDYLYSQAVTSGTAGQVLGVVDSTGTQVCPDAFTDWYFGTCALTGTAPFRVVLVPSGPHGHVRLLVQRTDSAAGCATWPRSAYGNSAGAHVTLTNTDNARCFVIPAAGRSAAELIEDADLTDGASATLKVNDPAGKPLCTGNGYPTDWTICDYQAGVTYTAILIGANFPKAGAKEEYFLARRDLTGNAACSSPVSTSPGGPTTSFTLGSSVAARCFRVTAATTDKLLFAFRDSAPTDPSAFQTPSALMLVTDSSGNVICSWILHCPAAGSDGYQAIEFTLDYTDVPITVHLDTWLVATSAGWAPACQEHQFSTDTTSAAVSTTLTDSADVYCGVVDMSPNQELSIYGSDTAVFPSSLFVSAYTASSWENPFENLGICSVGIDWCDIGPTQPAGQALLILAPFYQTQDPISFDMQAVCRFGCSVPRPVPKFTSIGPAAQAAGPGNTVVLTGTGLSFAVPFDLVAQNGREYSPAVPVSVNASGTALTLRLDTTQVPPGTYDVSDGDSCSPSPCSDWLLNAYRVTKGPLPPRATRFVPLAPERILDTQTGFGARQARVPAHGTITFPVNGRAGVPASRVAAVALDVSAVAPTRAGYLTVYADGRARPPAETADFTPGRSATGLVTVPVVNGRVAIYNGSLGSVDLTADVLGYDTSAAATGTRFKPVGPVRILRPDVVDAGQAVVLKVARAGGASLRGAKAVALDVTVNSPAKAGRLIAYADGATRPDVTSVSFAAGQRVTCLVITRVTGGKVDLYNSSGGSLKLTADAVGYYSAAGSTFHPVNALRVMDTRTGLGGAGGAILPHAAAEFSLLGNTVPPSGDVTAVELNVTVLGTRSAGALTVFPDGVLYQDGIALPNSTSLPGTPNIAFVPGQAQSNLVIVPTDALTDFYNGSNGNLQVIADLVGYYTS